MSLTSLRGLLVLGALGFVGVACSGSGGTTIETNGNGNGSSSSSGGLLGGPSPLTLIGQCDQICNNVVAQCAGESGLLQTCQNACGDLSVIQNTCLDPFASYLACVAGNAVTCTENGTYVLVTPPECEADREATLNCNAQPGIISACIALPGNSSCGANDAEGQPVFCVGAPSGCTPPEPNPLGIGVYCCPT
jgi:hypothetical protein